MPASQVYIAISNFALLLAALFVFLIGRTGRGQS